MARPVIVRQVLPAAPARVFALFTEGPELARWFCDAADSDVRPGGEVHAAWVDEDGEPWDRIGLWRELEPPHLAVLEWLDDDSDGSEGDGSEGEGLALTGSTQVVIPAADALENSAEPARRELLRVAIAPHPDGSMVTVVSPPMKAHPTIRPEVLQQAVQQGWEQTLQRLAELLAAEGNAPPT